MTQLEKLKAASDAAADAYTAAYDAAADAADGGEPDGWAAADVAWNTYAAAYNAWLAESNIMRGWLKLRNTGSRLTH
jgi:hypothetical protein